MYTQIIVTQDKSDENCKKGAFVRSFIHSFAEEINVVQRGRVGSGRRLWSCGLAPDAEEKRAGPG